MLAETMLPILVLATLAGVDEPRVRIETSIGAIGEAVRSSVAAVAIALSRPLLGSI